MPKVYLLDYVAGNVRSLVNAIDKVGYTVERIRSPEHVEKADVSAHRWVDIHSFFLIQFLRRDPLLSTNLLLAETDSSCVGHFEHCMTQFSSAGYLTAIRKHIESGKLFIGICVGLQALFEGSSESSVVPGLGLIKGHLDQF
jgi:imidazole glycerol-phosphate synthase